MADSIFKDILDKMCDHLKVTATTTLVNATIGLDTGEQARPYACLMVGEFSYNSDVNYTLDVSARVQVHIVGSETDEVQKAMEQVQKLWFNQTNFNELSALGVHNITPVAAVPAWGFDKQTQYEGDVAFDLVIRYTY